MIVCISAGKSMNLSPKVKARDESVPACFVGSVSFSAEIDKSLRLDFLITEESDARLDRRRPDSSAEGRLELLLDAALKLEPEVLLAAFLSFHEPRLLFCETKLNRLMEFVRVPVSAWLEARIVAILCSSSSSYMHIRVVMGGYLKYPRWRQDCRVEMSECRSQVRSGRTIAIAIDMSSTKPKTGQINVANVETSTWIQERCRPFACL